MLITILAIGTRGDVQPYLALGAALKKAGHRVRLAAFENYSEWVKNQGLEFYPVRGDVSKIAASQDVNGPMKADNPLKIILSFKKLSSFVQHIQGDLFAACKGSDAIVYHPGATIGYFAARQFDVPAILATPFPMTPTGEYPALIFYNSPRMGKTWNKATHKIFQSVMWMTGKVAVKGYWKKEFGSIPKDFACPFPKQTSRRYPTVVSCSDYVFPQPADWPEQVHNTGYWFLDEAAWEPPVDLLKFLQDGAPPVYVGFGSIGIAEEAEETTKLVLEALRLSGQRGILATGWSGMAKIAKVPENIYVLESAPHAWIFPRMAAVVHHGGAGTTAAGLRAGIPGVIIPFSNDQFAWGRRIQELGAGPKPIPRKVLTAQKLADAILLALQYETRKAAQEMGEKIRKENGAETAAQIIINCMTK